MSSYYNEFDPYAAQWIRNLISSRLIADGIVDERSIEDVHPIELREFTQCHFFAGIGVWSLALRSAGWPDDRRVWTGSCPCQPFSSAGKGDGFADERHLWPAFHHLISECKPAVVFGEQVASKDADPWIDLVHTDMETLGYAFGAVPFPSASVGAPHIRDRLYWVADSQHDGRDRSGRIATVAGGHESQQRLLDRDRAIGGLDHADDARLEGHGRGHCASVGQRQGSVRPTGQAGESGGLADTGNCASQRSESWAVERGLPAQIGRDVSQPTAGPTNGHWRAADWLLCRDGKWRPVEPGTFPLAHGAAGRVGRLRAYGNAINAIQAQEFISAWLDCQP